MHSRSVNQRPIPSWPVVSATVGQRIRQAREQQGWTQDELAARINVSRSAVAQWETDRAGQMRGNLARIADVLRVTIEFLIYGEVDERPTSAGTREEGALLRLYRLCEADDRDLILRTVRKLARETAGGT